MAGYQVASPEQAPSVIARFRPPPPRLSRAQVPCPTPAQTRFLSELLFWRAFMLSLRQGAFAA